jgi:hypothetical protein
MPIPKFFKNWLTWARSGSKTNEAANCGGPSVRYPGVFAVPFMKLIARRTAELQADRYTVKLDCFGR